MDDGQRIAQITELLEKYFDGLHRSDADLLATVFHPEARYVTASDSPPTMLTMGEYLPIVAGRDSPQSLGQQRDGRIVSIEFAGTDTALARVELSMAPKRFQDFLTLILVDGRWQIISKVFHYDLDE